MMIENLESLEYRVSRYKTDKMRVVFSSPGWFTQKLVLVKASDPRINAYPDDKVWQTEIDKQTALSEQRLQILADEKARLRSAILDYPKSLNSEKFAMLVTLACTTDMQVSEIHSYVECMNTRRWFCEYHEKIARNPDVGPGWDADETGEYDLLLSGLALLPQDRVKAFRRQP